MAKPMQSTKDYDSNSLDVHYYFEVSNKKNEQEFYNDNGKTAEAFEKGEYEILEFEAELEKSCLEIEFEAKIGSNYKPQSKNINLIIHNINKKPKRIKIDRKKVVIDWNEETKTLRVPVKWNTLEETEIRIKLNK